MRVPFFLSKVFPANNDRVRRYLRREDRHGRGSVPQGSQEFSPEREHLKYEILRSSI
jgi:hypothetical protein